MNMVVLFRCGCKKKQFAVLTRCRVLHSPTALGPSKHTNMWSPLLGLTIVMTHRNIRCLQRSLFVTKKDWWLVGSYRFSNLFICLILLPWMGQAFTNKVMNQKSYIFFAASGVHPILNPPLLSAEARDATGPSLSGGPSPSPCRRVSGLGGPELVTPMLLHQIVSATTFKLFIEWNDRSISRSFDVNLLKWDSRFSFAMLCSSWSDGGWNETKFNLLKAMNLQRLPLSQYLPTKRLFQVSSAMFPQITKKSA